MFQALDLPVLMPPDREHLVGCNLRRPPHSGLEVTGSAGLIIQQQAQFAIHTPLRALSNTHDHGCVPTVAAGLPGDV